MADRVWKSEKVFGHSKQLLVNKFFDPSTPSVRKGNSGETGEEKKRLMKIVATTSLPTAGTPHARAKRLMRTVATTSLPAVDRPNDTA